MDQKEIDSLSNELLKYKKFLQKREEEIRQGKNNYSLLGSVLGIHDEVRLHSRFIYSMINPNGSHFQNDLFLKLFIECIDPKILKNFSLSNAQVFKERDNIDLLIEDGNTFIIIENKLLAGEQKNQISRYIETIEKYGNLEHKPKIIVVYLSITGKNPSKYSLNEYNINQSNKQIYLQDQSYDYYPISYKKSIPQWVHKCIDITKEVHNLHNAFYAYQDILNKVNKTMNSNNVMTFSNSILSQTPENLMMSLQLSAEIMNNFHRIWAEHLMNNIMLIDNFKNLIIDDSENPLFIKPLKDRAIINQLNTHSLIKWLAKDKFKTRTKEKFKDIGLSFTHSKFKNRTYIIFFATDCLYIGAYDTKLESILTDKNIMFGGLKIRKLIETPSKIPQICQEIQDRIEKLINQE